MADLSLDHKLSPEEKQAALRIENLKLGMWLFLASEVVLFSVLIAFFIVFRFDNPEIVAEIHEHAGLFLVTSNTFLLLTSSWTMVRGLVAIQRNDKRGLAKWITATAILGIIFVSLQVVEYRALSAEGVTLYDSEFGMRFYVPTAVHGLHVVVGVLWAFFVVRGARRGSYSAKNYLGVEMFGLYWHFVDVVWIFLFTLIYLI